MKNGYTPDENEYSSKIPIVIDCRNNFFRGTTKAPIIRDGKKYFAKFYQIDDPYFQASQTYVDIFVDDKEKDLILPIIAVIEDNHIGCIITEYAELDLYSSIFETSEELSSENKLIIITFLFNILEMLGKHGMLHLDIKPENIVIRTSKPNISLSDLKLIDFESLRAFNEEPKEFICTPLYAPPEYLNVRTIHETYDVFSVGILIYHLITGTSTEEERKYGIPLSFDSPNWDDFPHFLKQLVKEMIDPVARKRPPPCPAYEIFEDGMKTQDQFKQNEIVFVKDQNENDLWKARIINVEPEFYYVTYFTSTDDEIDFDESSKVIAKNEGRIFPCNDHYQLEYQRQEAERQVVIKILSSIY